MYILGRVDNTVILVLASENYLKMPMRWNPIPTHGQLAHFVLGPPLPRWLPPSREGPSLRGTGTWLQVITTQLAELEPSPPPQSFNDFFATGYNRRHHRQFGKCRMDLGLLIWSASSLPLTAAGASESQISWCRLDVPACIKESITSTDCAFIVCLTQYDTSQCCLPGGSSAVQSSGYIMPCEVGLAELHNSRSPESHQVSTFKTLFFQRVVVSVDQVPSDLLLFLNRCKASRASSTKTRSGSQIPPSFFVRLWYCTLQSFAPPTSESIHTHGNSPR